VEIEPLSLRKSHTEFREERREFLASVMEEFDEKSTMSSASSIARPVLTQELRGGCGAGEYSGARGMTSHGEGESI